MRLINKIEFQLFLQVSNCVVSPVREAIATSEKSFNQECLWQKNPIEVSSFGSK